MSSLLEELFVMYGQDFDVVFEHDTDPIDLFCLQHNIEDQYELLRNLNDLLKEGGSREISNSGLKDMGLEYAPGGWDQSPRIWLPPIISYLARKLGANQQQA